MVKNSLKNRSEQDPAFQWDIKAMIPDESVIEPELEKILSDAENYENKYRGHLADSADTLGGAYVDRDDIWRRLEKIYVYARMKRDEDNGEAAYQALTDRCRSVIASVSSSLSFFAPELMSCEEKDIVAFIQENEDLKTYEFAIKDSFRLKKHVLSDAEENILAQMSEVTGATGDIFTMLNNADMTFATIKNEDGEDEPLTHGNYIRFMDSDNREVRKAAYEAMYDPYRKFINTIATTYNYNTKVDVVGSRIRKYESSRAAALAPDNIPGAVYDNLVSVVNEHLPAMHRFIGLKKKLLGVEDFKMYDFYAPLIKIPKKDIPFEEGLDIIREALKPFGEDYISKMNEGIDQKWIDVYENKGKTSGAYSFGCYDSYPYILLNYTDTLNDVFTIIHEMGHSMHSRYTRDAQPYVYGGHSIFTAEVASTVNESLLMHYLLENTDDVEMKKYLLNMHLDAFRTTLFRQTMFAEFEDMTHKAIESGSQLTAQWLCEKYHELNSRYYGPDVDEDDVIRYEWARIPHFYNAFYVYKYATGYSAATAITEKILKEGRPAAESYIQFLKTGESDHPIELLKIAGVDMSSPKPVEDAMITFEKTLDELESLLGD